MPHATPRILAMVPVYNHAATLRGVVEGLLTAGLPVLVVDDGSTDGALERVADLPIWTHRMACNQGKGAAIRAGAERAAREGFDALLTVDADGQHDPAEARLLIDAAAAEWPGIVIGSRRMTGPHVPQSSHFGRAFSNFWVRLECGRRLGDTQSGYRIYPVDFLRDTSFLTRRYTFEVEVLVRAAWRGLSIRDVDVSVDYPPGDARISHFRAFRDNLRLSLLHTWLVCLSLRPWTIRTRPEPIEAAEVKRLLFHPVRLFRRVAEEHSSPLELATAVWMGVFLGGLPIIPFGIATILYVNHRLHLNKLAGVAASNLCVAPFVPFLFIQIGHFLRYGVWWTAFTRQTLLAEIHLRLWEWLLGALLVGPVLALLAALPTYAVLRGMRARR